MKPATTAEADELEQRKSNTMGSMHIGSTITKPNVDSIISAVSTILHSQMVEVKRIQLTLRIKIKAVRLDRKEISFSSLKRSTYWRSLSNLISRESNS
jgi:hypothetical protein